MSPRSPDFWASRYHSVHIFPPERWSSGVAEDKFLRHWKRYEDRWKLWARDLPRVDVWHRGARDEFWWAEPLSHFFRTQSGSKTSKRWRRSDHHLFSSTRTSASFPQQLSLEFFGTCKVVNSTARGEISIRWQFQWRIIVSHWILRVPLGPFWRQDCQRLRGVRFWAWGLQEFGWQFGSISAREGV